MLFEKGNRLLMIGDSITDCSRVREADAGHESSLGNGYVNLVNAYINGRYPQQQLLVINQGISGNRVTDLADRWDCDVMAYHPDWVSIMIGINDVWRHFDRARQQKEQVSAEQFRQIYRMLIEKTQKHTKGIILMTPFMIEPERNEPMRRMMDDYGDVVKSLAREYGLIIIDVQKRFDEYLKHAHSYTLASDRIHPNLQGHMIIANAFWEGIGL